MITTRLIHIPTTGIDYDVCHLFEHLVIESFLNHLDKSGYSPSLFGWLNGRTFEDHVFFDAGFYNDQQASDFDTFMLNLPEWDNAIIERCLDAIGCETQQKYQIRHPETLAKLLSELRRRVLSGDLPEVTPAVSPFTIEKSANEYRDVLLVFALPTDNTRLSALFLRLHVIIEDILQYTFRKNTVCYPVSDLSELNEYPGGIGVAQKWRVKKGTSTKELRNHLQDALNTFDVSTHAKELYQHFEVFAQEDWLRHLPIHFYERTGIVTTNQEISQLATAANIETAMKMTELNIRPWHKYYENFFK